MQTPDLYPENLVWIAAMVGLSVGYLTRSIKARFERIARERIARERDARERDAIREHRARNLMLLMLLMLRSLAQRAAAFDPAK